MKQQRHQRITPAQLRAITEEIRKAETSGDERRVDQLLTEKQVLIARLGNQSKGARG